MVFLEWSSPQHVACRMIWFSAIPNLIAIATLITTVCLGAGRGPLSASACYGNTNEWIRLECVEGEKINVTKIIHGAKLKSDSCPSPADISTYRRECCLRNTTDCLVTVQDSASVECNGKVMCSVKSTWSMVSKECNQDNYLDHTNYMIMEFTCVGPPTSVPPAVSSTQVKVTEQDFKNTTFLVGDKVIETSFDNKTTSRSSTRTVDVTSVKTTTTSHSVGVNVTTTSLPSRTSTVSVVSNTQKHTATSNESKDELSDAMVGAIVGGSLGMLFTLMAFIFYWGRKRRLRIVGKSQPTVWDYLLSQTFTVRGTRGYDHFASVRSSVRSDSEANSPTSRKTTWLPNIVHRDSIPRDDSISNYDNDTDRQHSVEIHPHATPTPYAFLNLYVDPGNQTHHDA